MLATTKRTVHYTVPSQAWNWCDCDRQDTLTVEKDLSESGSR